MAPTVQFPATIKEYWEKGILEIRTSCERHLLIIPDEAKIQEAYKKGDTTSDNNAFCAFKKQLCEYGFKIVGRKDWPQLQVPSHYMWVYEHDLYNQENMLKCQLHKPMKKIAIRFLMNPETYEVEWQNCPKTVQFADRIIDCIQACAANYAGKKAMHRSGAYKNSMGTPYFRTSLNEELLANSLMNLDEDDELGQPPSKKFSPGGAIHLQSPSCVVDALVPRLPLTDLRVGSKRSSPLAGGFANGLQHLGLNALLAAHTSSAFSPLSHNNNVNNASLFEPMRSAVKPLRMPMLSEHHINALKGPLLSTISPVPTSGYNTSRTTPSTIVTAPVVTSNTSRITPQQQLIESLLNKATIHSAQLSPLAISSQGMKNHAIQQPPSVNTGPLNNSRSSSSESIPLASAQTVDAAKEALRRAGLLGVQTTGAPPIELATQIPDSIFKSQLPFLQAHGPHGTRNAEVFNGINADVVNAINLSRQIKREAGEIKPQAHFGHSFSPQSITAQNSEGTIMQLVPMIVKSSALKNSNAKWITADKLTAEGVSIDLQQ
jgi:hypothetical protein